MNHHRGRHARTGGGTQGDTQGDTWDVDMEIHTHGATSYADHQTRGNMRFGNAAGIPDNPKST